MAKDQKRGNREARKPKKAKGPAVATPVLPAKGATTSIGVPSKKR